MQLHEHALTPLALAYVSNRPPDSDSGPLPALETALRGAFEDGAAAWPGVELSPEDFASYLGERSDAALPPLAGLAAVQLSDLYLACACAGGSTAAIGALDSRYLSRLRATMLRINSSPAFADEMIQRLRIHLLTRRQDAAGEGEPRIGLYRGKATLWRWLVIVATRMAVDHEKREESFSELDQVLQIASFESPELALLRRRHLGDFNRSMKSALAETLAELTTEERNLLRWHLVENLSLRKIAIVRGSNVWAVSREYARIRATIRSAIIERLRSSTGLSGEELDSLMNVLISRISLTGGLGPGPGHLDERELPQR
jgi:RNA polymerase sigma-70 factor, ECF subfamily